MTSINESEISGAKWEILETVAKEPISPKGLAKILGSTQANMSQQLKLLEAYGYVKKKRVDKGPGSRKKNDSRIVYSLSKNLISVTKIHPLNIKKEEIRLTPLNQFLANIMLCDIKEGSEELLELYITRKDLFKDIDVLFYLRTESKEIHLLVVTENLDKFRGDNSTIDLSNGEGGLKLRFWSHTIQDMKKGISKQEKYFVEQMKIAKFLYEKKLNYSTHILEGYDE